MNNDHNIQINTLSTMYVCMYVYATYIVILGVSIDLSALREVERLNKRNHIAGLFTRGIRQILIESLALGLAFL